MVSNFVTSNAFRKTYRYVMSWELEEKKDYCWIVILGMIIDNAEDLWIGSTFRWRQRGANAFHEH